MPTKKPNQPFSARAPFTPVWLACLLSACTPASAPTDGGATTDGGADAATQDATTRLYVSADFETNVVAERALIAQFEALLEAMEAAEADAMVTPSYDALAALYAGGLRNATAPYFQTRADAILMSFALGAGRSWSPDMAPAARGGRYGAGMSFDIFDGRGVDLREQLEKGLFASAFYNRAYTLAHASDRDARTVDRILALYGAPPSFPNSDQGMPPDKYSAKYAERRDNEMDPQPGLYRRIQAQFLDARAAAVAGDAAARDAALAGILRNWERVLFATAVYYTNDAITKLQRGTTADLASGLHELGEATGFVMGWRMLPSEARTVTDADVDAILALLRSPIGADASTYLFAVDTMAHVPELQMALARIQTAQGFSDAEMMAFRNLY